MPVCCHHAVMMGQEHCSGCLGSLCSPTSREHPSFITDSVPHLETACCHGEPRKLLWQMASVTICTSTVAGLLLPVLHSRFIIDFLFFSALVLLIERHEERQAYKKPATAESKSSPLGSHPGLEEPSWPGVTRKVD